MANIRTKKTVYSRDDFDKAVDRSFTTFVDIDEEENDTVEELLRLYDKLYYELPIEGETGSHEYIIKKSSKLVNIEKDLTEIQPLLDEITQLREQLLLANQQLIEAQMHDFEDHNG
jgi:hypothetical protein